MGLVLVMRFVLEVWQTIVITLAFLIGGLAYQEHISGGAAWKEITHGIIK